MSFNDLPDELVAMVGSHMKIGDVTTLLQTHKRIQNVVKRYKLHKPAVENLRFDFNRNRFGSIRALCQVDLELGKPTARVRQEDLYGTENEFIDSCLKKVKSVSSLLICASNAEVFLINEEFNWILLKANIKIKNIFIEEFEIRFKSEGFVSFCKKFDDVKFYNCKMSLILLSDEILCQILPNTKFDFSSHYTFANTQQLEISDRTLDAMINHKLPEQFVLDRPRTNFTIAGVRRLAEFCSDSDYEYEIALGILNKNQAAEAQQWFNYAERRPALPYQLELFQNGRRLQLNIWKKDDREMSFVSVEIDDNILMQEDI